MIESGILHMNSQVNADTQGLLRYKDQITEGVFEDVCHKTTLASITKRLSTIATAQVASSQSFILNEKLLQGFNLELWNAKVIFDTWLHCVSLLMCVPVCPLKDRLIRQQ